MRQATTPKHTFTLPFEIPNGSMVRVIYAQKKLSDDIILFVKNSDSGDCEVIGNTITLTLSQEETLKFDARYYALIQIRILTPDNESLVSNIMSVTVDECLEREAINFKEA